MVKVVLIIFPHALRFLAKHFGKSRDINKDSDVYWTAHNLNKSYLWMSGWAEMIANIYPLGLSLLPDVYLRLENMVRE